MLKKNAFLLAVGISLLTGAGCGNSNDGSTTTTENTTGSNEATESNASGDQGIGKFKNVELTHPLDEQMVAKGKAVYELKCQSCHKLTEEKLVGPGWKGVTDRRTPEWIMNFVTNVDEMIEKDPEAQKMLEECLVRMPNQNLSDEDARTTYEFMRKVDGKN